MTDWDTALYRQFEQERTRPAADLLAQVAARDPGTIVDLGCGPGNSTELLARRFPRATITGLDLSADMLNAARERLPMCRFEAQDIATWTPRSPPDLVFANASLQWVPDHASLIPRLLDSLAPGGTLAVQMPLNRDEPSHEAMRQVAAEPLFAAHIGSAAASRVRVQSAAAYYDMLAQPAASVDVWLTVYQHPMLSPAAIVTWLRSTGLRPFLDALPANLHGAFLARYESALDGAYPTRADGTRLLAFPRLFLIATRA